MNCSSVQDRLDLYLDEVLDPAVQESITAHIATCVECAGIVAVFSGDQTFHPEMTEQVVAATGSDSCGTARESFADAIDVPSDLAVEHVDHCLACQTFVRTLGDIDAVLPTLAALDPGDAFTDSVLHATLGAPQAENPAWLVNLTTLWDRLTERPNFSLELAYVCTVLVVLLTAPPGAPLRATATSGLGWLQSDAKAEAIPLDTARDLSGQMRAEVRDDLSERGEQISVVWKRVQKHRGQLFDALMASEFEAVPPVLEDLKCDVKLLWDGIRKRLPSGEEPTCGEN